MDQKEKKNEGKGNGVILEKKKTTKEKERE